MNKQDYKIHIIGAGVSGLIAAIVLENHGYHPVVLETS
ncbi:NAD(P)-binding protein, partial [Flavobacteriaceae bacterium]|nr:NAD(P)-binding protein [Flavobacteriaceae bacterium]